ncbi:hypothetical protein PISMIDRAFT_678914 [Pisolithus microcarpus 441]|uniref:Uncharacterized protein n=1 Tax=Pisolithus microcarpus 441 TaxID=765257 RepID=A0A0C9ZNH5_9AGAM|nr:hypothetical protein PISMIDRAFT_678914 [Pisolithus microcarpus 441]
MTEKSEGHKSHHKLVDQKKISVRFKLGGDRIVTAAARCDPDKGRRETWSVPTGHTIENTTLGMKFSIEETSPKGTYCHE